MPKKIKSVESRAKIKSVVVISDQHIASGTGLFTMKSWQNDTGQSVLPSPLQRAIAAYWDEFWGEFIPKATHGEPFAVVNNGDCLEGVHHGAVDMITHNKDSQKEMSVKTLRRVVDACDGRYYHIRGTEAHVGPSGQDEEAVARELRAIPSRTGHHARWDMWFSLVDDIIHFTHHIGTTSSNHHETTALNAEITNALNETARWGTRRPSWLVRSHRHRTSKATLPTANGEVTCIVTPAWQGKTPFTYRLPGARFAPPQIGGIVLRHGDGGIYSRTFVRAVSNSELVTPE